MGERQRKERLQAAGLWEDFVALRAQLVAGGMAPAQADEEAQRQVKSRPPRQQELPPWGPTSSPLPGVRFRRPTLARPTAGGRPPTPRRCSGWPRT